MAHKPLTILLRIVGWALLATSSSVGVLAEDAEFELPFFREIWSGSASFNLPDGMPDPRKLRREFEAEPKVLDWAVESEEELTRSINSIKSARVSASRVKCHSSICEVIFIIPDNSILDRTVLFEEVDRFLGASAMKLDKEVTMSVGGGQQGVTGVLAYLHDRRE